MRILVCGPSVIINISELVDGSSSIRALVAHKRVMDSNLRSEGSIIPLT